MGRELQQQQGVLGLTDQERRSISERILFTPRVGGEGNYLKLIQLSDVMLHPFPFGGAKTAADCAAAGRPLVAMRARFLRGRMAYAVHRHLGTLEHCVVPAGDINGYGHSLCVCVCVCLEYIHCIVVRPSYYSPNLTRKNI